MTGPEGRLVDLTGDAGTGYCFDALVTKTGPGWPAPEVPIMTQLLERGVHFLFAPMNVARGTGAPGRALAWVPDEDGEQP